MLISNEGYLMGTQKRCLGYVAIVIDDYDRAIDYYTNRLGFSLIEYTPQADNCWDLYQNR